MYTGPFYLAVRMSSSGHEWFDPYTVTKLSPDDARRRAEDQNRILGQSWIERNPILRIASVNLEEIT